ncbi:lysozyme inhibitor LprI family protein [Rufibacter glacialis]|nr:lysozyme inhibitor LprI family protein [Rufibacter glacialis]
MDGELQARLDTPQNYTTSGMMDCLARATEEWESELNQHYKAFLALLAPQQKGRLKAVQRK